MLAYLPQAVYGQNKLHLMLTCVILCKMVSDLLLMLCVCFHSLSFCP